MNRFTANYINTDSNFEIHNLQYTKKRDEYHSLYCVLLNLIQRGDPTKPSLYLSDKIDHSYSGSHKIHFFTKENPKWGNIIKGYDETDQYPARDFFDTILPRMFPEYPFFKQLILPEAAISDFIHDGNKAFYGQKVDFLVVPFKTVIEIDGSQHADVNQSALDAKRDDYLKNNGYEVIRIPSKDIAADNCDIHKKAIWRAISRYIEELSPYNDDYYKCVEGYLSSGLLKTVATIRFQVLILQLCLNGVLSLNDSVWKIAINNHEVTGYESSAIRDILLWLKNLCVLSGLTYREPEISITQTSQLSSFGNDTIKVDFSIYEKVTHPESMTPDRIYVRNCWDQDEDYFRLAIGAPIKYHIEDYVSDKELDLDEMNPRRVALRFILKNLYGFDGFRPGQERIVMNALRGRDTIGVLPTGSGKSLCYQLAVFLQPCVSFCICPIKSLMIDQDANLKHIKIRHTAYLSSDLTGEERQIVQDKFANGKYLCVFMSPERFQSEDFRRFLGDMSRRNHITFGYAVLDEVHCLSEWGHGFRVSYLNLVRTIRKYCKGAVLLGLTATASFNVLKNILIEFGMEDKRDVISIPSFTRPELSFKVITIENDKSKIREEYKKEYEKETGKPFDRDISDYNRAFKDLKYSKLTGIIKRYLKFYPDLLDAKGDGTRCGLVFTAYVNGDNGCYELSKRLKMTFHKDVRAFAGESPKKYKSEDGEGWETYKRNVQDGYKDNEYALLCSTKAFGMGIDKPNVRYTIHYGIPSSLESLYQEAGRAGRDKRSAECTVIYAKESKDFREKIDDLLKVETLPSQIGAFTQDLSNFKKGADAFRQLVLLAGSSDDVEDELENIKWIIQNYCEPGEASFINIKEIPNDKIVPLQELQKYIYHLSLIGVVDDWTVDWKLPAVKIYCCNYTSESIYSTTEKYIRNYEPDFIFENNEHFRVTDGNDVAGCIENASRVFLHWYADNILYSRRQALQNVMEACDKYDKEGPEAFKDRMESYFRLDDVADILGTIAEQPRDVTTWFDVLDVKRVNNKEKVSGLIMNINRFLESFQRNVGLNYISGLLHLIERHFDDPNGKDRLTAALDVIKTFDDADKEYVLAQSAILINELDDTGLADEFTEFFIRNYDFDETDRIIYNNLQSDYSLQTFLKRMMVKMNNMLGGNR